LCLSSSQDGKTRQVPIPAALEADVRQWVDNYHRIRDVLEEVSEQTMAKLHARKRELKGEDR
jgi:hypothetical protein